jgi:hypothetical protein
MSIIGSNILAGASGQVGGGYTIENSLRFRASASAYLTRTPASAGNRKTWTLSFWVKFGKIQAQTLFATRTNTNPFGEIRFESDGGFFFYGYTGAAYQYRFDSTALFRDTSAWYHFVFVMDTTDGTEGNRTKIYVNGLQLTAFDNSIYPTENLDTNVNNAVAHDFGYDVNSTTQAFDGYLAEVNFIEGSTPATTTRVVNGVTQTILTEFGEFNADTGVWQPVAYAGTYGTNGFYLPFSDATNTTTLVADSSGNGNDWTPNNISLTSGVTYDSMTDTPTIYEDGGNYAVINPLNNSGGTTIADGNLKTTWGSASTRSVLSTMAIPDSGKFYAEFVVGSLTNANVAASFGLATASVSRTSDGYYASGAWVYYASNQSFISRELVTSSQIGSNQTFAAGGIVQVAVDRTNNQAWLGYNNVWVNATNGTDGNPSAGTNPTVSSLPADLFIIIGLYANNGNVNFGQRPFAYTPPTDFLPLHTGNLPDSAIVDGGEYFNTVLYTGNSSTQSITGVGFQPAFTWIKNRSTASQHVLTDAVRGVTKQLFSSLTNEEQTSSTGITSFDSDGFSLDINVSPTGSTNGSPDAYVAWNWKANGAGVSNDEGSITSTVSANTTAGFSVVTYNSGSSGNKTVGHGLGIKPSMIITKSRTAVSSFNWAVYHVVTATTVNKYMVLNTNETVSDNGSSIWGASLADTNLTTFGINSGNAVNASTDCIAYCFADVEGYSKFGGYTGNGLPDGTFVYTGFRPAFVMIKLSSGSDNWAIFDTSRLGYNLNNNELQANNNYTEGSAGFIDIVSNGFKNRNADTRCNASGSTYIYMAFAENPFKNSLAR